MYKKDIVAEIAERTKLNKKDIDQCITAFLDVVKDTLVKGEKVCITGFGTFDTVERAAREGRNPHDGSTIHIAASKAVKFKASKTFKDSVQN